MTFRSSDNDDYFGSYLRRHTFQHMAQREVALDTIIGWGNEDKLVLTDDNNPLSKWQEEDAPHHWQCESIDFFVRVIRRSLRGPLAFFLIRIHLII